MYDDTNIYTTIYSKHVIIPYKTVYNQYGGIIVHEKLASSIFVIGQTYPCFNIYADNRQYTVPVLYKIVKIKNNRIYYYNIQQPEHIISAKLKYSCDEKRSYSFHFTNKAGYSVHSCSGFILA